jgi:hypothetical protein
MATPSKLYISDLQCSVADSHRIIHVYIKKDTADHGTATPLKK